MKAALSITDAAQEIGIGKTKLYAEISAGRITPRKLGKRTIILAEELNRYLNNLPEAA